jgi:site-specific DNA-cytosine methylase
MNRKKGNRIAPDLIPEFSRCVMEAAPDWFVMENVPAAPAPDVTGFHVETLKINNRELGEEQNRERRFYFGSRRLLAPLSAFIERKPENEIFKHCVRTSGYMKPEDSTRRGRLKGFHYGYQSEYSFRQCAQLQGLPEDFLSQAPFTLAGKFKVLGNGVPLPLGRTISRAVRLSIEGADAPGCLKFG